MPTEDLTARTYVPTQPLDTDDQHKFGQLSEITKDVFKKELIDFFDYTTSDAAYKLVEVPNIQKFALGAGSGENDLETVVNILMAYADWPDQFPMVAITSANLREHRMGLGSSFVAHVQEPPRIEGTETGPFNLTDGWTLEVTTWPLGTVASATTSTITFSSTLFSDMTSISITELVNAIKFQALYYTPEATPTGTLRLKTGGPCAQSSPNYIEVTGGDTACLTALGFTLGDSDIYTNTERPPKNRYALAGDLTINIDVVSDDINTRGELTDLVYQFFGYYMEKRNFEFIGRSFQEEGLDFDEFYHIILNGQFAWSSEMNTVRPGGEQKDYIYAQRGSVAVSTIDFIDKDLVASPVFLENSNVRRDTTLPQGDFFGRNFLRDR